MEWPRYAAIVAEYDSLLSYAKEASASLIGLTPPTSHQGYGEQIFVKLLAHCITLRQLSPDPERANPKELWDLASVSAIARSIIETHDALMYVALGAITLEERQFRILLWELHDSNRRAKMLEAIGSTDPRYLDIVANDQQLHERVLAHQFFARLSKSVQGKVRDRDPPPFHLTQRERCSAYRINFDYYNAVTMQLSQYVHTLPYSVHQLFAFKAGSPEGLHLMSLPIQYTLAFLSRSIQGLVELFPDHIPAPKPAVQRLIAVWSAFVERGAKSAV